MFSCYHWIPELLTSSIFCCSNISQTICTVSSLIRPLCVFQKLLNWRDAFQAVTSWTDAFVPQPDSEPADTSEDSDSDFEGVGAASASK